MEMLSVNPYDSKIDLIRVLTRCNNITVYKNNVKVKLTNEILYNKKLHIEILKGLKSINCKEFREYEDNTSGNIYLMFTM